MTVYVLSHMSLLCLRCCIDLFTSLHRFIVSLVRATADKLTRVRGGYLHAEEGTLSMSLATLAVGLHQWCFSDAHKIAAALYVQQ